MKTALVDSKVLNTPKVFIRLMKMFILQPAFIPLNKPFIFSRLQARVWKVRSRMGVCWWGGIGMKVSYLFNMITLFYCPWKCSGTAFSNMYILSFNLIVTISSLVNSISSLTGRCKWIIFSTWFFTLCYESLRRTRCLVLTNICIFVSFTYETYTKCKMMQYFEVAPLCWLKVMTNTGIKIVNGYHYLFSVLCWHVLWKTVGEKVSLLFMMFHGFS